MFQSFVKQNPKVSIKNKQPCQHANPTIDYTHTDIFVTFTFDLGVMAFQATAMDCIYS